MHYMIFVLLFKHILEHFFVIACSWKFPRAIPGIMNVLKYLVFYDSFITTKTFYSVMTCVCDTFHDKYTKLKIEIQSTFLLKLILCLVFVVVSLSCPLSNIINFKEEFCSSFRQFNFLKEQFQEKWKNY